MLPAESRTGSAAVPGERAARELVRIRSWSIAVLVLLVGAGAVIHLVSGSAFPVDEAVYAVAGLFATLALVLGIRLLDIILPRSENRHDSDR